VPFMIATVLETTENDSAFG